MTPAFTNPLLEMFDTIEVLQAYVNASAPFVAVIQAHAQSIGNLCISFASLDRAISGLYAPLLQCSAAQAACIVDENISRRTAVAIKLLHLEPLDPDWVDWVSALLRRSDGELGAGRNRYIHDLWQIGQGGTVRVDPRAKLGRPQSHQRPTVQFDTVHPTAEHEIGRLGERVSTVATALAVAKIGLETWRQTGQPPQLDPQWLPACKPQSRCLNYLASGEALELPLVTLEYAFD
jgi:hypothetical protein